MNKTKKRLIIAVITATVFIALGVVAAFLTNFHVIRVGNSKVITAEQVSVLTDVDCILVLGCGVREDGTPSHMLEDRLRQGVALYHAGAAPKLLMSGDHGRIDYNEVATMKAYALENGVAAEDVFLDHAGFSTYESIYRAKEIFGVDKVLIVSQEYHLYRALYLAESFDIEAYGVPADYRLYRGQGARELREILARVKDSVTAVFKPKPTFLGDAIPISGDGSVTDDN